VIDRAIQVHGGAGVSNDTVLARFWASGRTLRIVDGPDAVHLRSVAREELERERPYAG
jgi:acyl-CoA dehydrogenase